MEDKLDTFSELTELIAQLVEQKNLIYVHCAQIVTQIISGRITEQCKIEYVMDVLIDFGDDERFLALYKKLCQYVYNSYPSLVGKHIALFRPLSEDHESEEGEPAVQ